MTEAEWLATDDVSAMLAWLVSTALASGYVATDRRLRLFACACCRAMGHKDADALLRPVEHAADHGPVPVAAWHALERAMPCEGFRWCCRVDAVEAARVWAESTTIAGPGEKAALLREVVGNPYRPVTRCGTCNHDAAAVVIDGPCPDCYRTPDVVRFAQRVYADRDFAALPVLADALEDAGCTDAAILNHLRFERCPDCDGRGRWQDGGAEIVCCWCHGTGGNGPHVRGCWALDLILGKE
jgi:hypothetical protein